ncbi:MAG: hypothetical protein ACQEP1_03575 [Nanobdellota archaeon]
MKETMVDAVEELKRVDHLIYVSLKYTRTVDVIRGIIKRLIDCFKTALDGMLEEVKDQVYEVPTAPMLRVKILKEHYDDEKLSEYIDFYLMLRRIYNSDFSRSGEFRKNVTMTITNQGEKPTEITTGKVTEFYEKTKEFLHYVQDNYSE